MACNLDQLEILNELQIDFANLAENGFNLIENYAGIGWSKYFKLDQL